MFEIGDYVMKTSNGVCHVDDITQINISGVDKNKLYYVLTPVEGKKSTLYVSVDTASQNIRAALTPDEAKNVLDSIPQISEAWIENDKVREQQYKEAVRSGSPEALIGILKTIYYRKKEREIKGKKNTAVDERYFKQAENLLFAEIAFALGKNKDDVGNMIFQHIE